MRLWEEGAEVVSAGTTLDTVRGKDALEAVADATPSEIDSADFDGVVVPDAG